MKLFIVLAYDVNQKRVSKIMKLCRKYLTHIQKSVFEGILTEKSLAKLKREISNAIDCNVDHVCLYQWESMKYTKKEQIGMVKKNSNIL